MTKPNSPAQPPQRARRSPSPDERQRDPERTRRRILDAAIAELADKGFAGARVSSIADRAGVNKQLISYYFGGKDGLYRTIVDTWSQREGETEHERRSRSLSEVVTAYVPKDEGFRALTRLNAWEGLTAEVGEHSVEAQTNRMREAVADLERRQQAGELADDIDPRCFLLAFMAAAGAAATMPQLVRSIFAADPDSPEVIDHYADQLARMVHHLRER